MALHLEQLERLSAEWKGLQPLSAAHEQRLWLKLRLEWNYHSNHIEGNTLTYGETAALLLHDQHSGNHTGREYDEMKGHDLAIKRVRELAVSPQVLTEAHIRDLNQIILKEPFYKDAITPDGGQSHKLITPGRYKEEPNSVRTSTGELFEYASPTEVPMRMPKLVEAIRSSVGKEGLEFMAALAITHHEFTLIHPFDDGNGRVVRLVTNYVLLKKGLPPLVISSERKKDYLSALRQADGGDPAMLVDFFADQLIWSLQLGIKAAKGESLEEPRDVDKKIDLFIREQKSNSKNVVLKSAEVLEKWLKAGFQALLNAVDERTEPLGELFASRIIQIGSDVSPKRTSWRNVVDLAGLSNGDKLPDFVKIIVMFDGYRGEANSPFKIHDEVVIELDRYEYHVSVRGGGASHAIYSENISQEQEDQTVDRLLQNLMEMIKRQSEKK